MPYASSSGPFPTRYAQCGEPYIVPIQSPTWVAKKSAVTWSGRCAQRARYARRGAVLLSLVLAATLPACDGSGGGTQADPEHGGPLDRGGVYGYQLTISPQAAARGFTDGLIRLQLDGDDPATITSVRSNGGEGVVELLGSKISGPDRRFGATESAIGWPPSKQFGSDVTDAEGARLLPRSQSGPMGYELLLGYKVLDPDTYGARESVIIDYQVGDVTYTFTEQARIVFCPVSATRAACTDYADRQFPNG